MVAENLNAQSGYLGRYLISHLFVRYFAHSGFQISDFVKWFQQNVPEEQGRGVQAQDDLDHIRHIFCAHLPTISFLYSLSFFSAFHPVFPKLSLDNQNVHSSLEDLNPPQIAKKLIFMELLHRE